MTRILTYRGGAALLIRGKQGVPMTADEREERAILLAWGSKDWCEEHQRRHLREERLAILRRMLPCDAEELHEQLLERWPCIWTEFERDGAGDARHRRDMKAIGAQYRRESGEWGL